MSGEHTPTSRLLDRAMHFTADIPIVHELADALTETAAERDRLRADLATCGKDWADERQAAQAEAAALRAEVERLQAELRVAYKLPLAMGHPIAVELESLRAEKAELVAALYEIIGLDHHNHGPESRATKIARVAVIAAKATATEGGE